MKMSMADETKG